MNQKDDFICCCGCQSEKDGKCLIFDRKLERRSDTAIWYKRLPECYDRPQIVAKGKE